jgi:GDP-L-fucose synthase
MAINMKKLYIAGHNGMVGSALVRAVEKSDKYELIVASRDQLNLLDQRAVFDFLNEKKPDVVIIAAAKVGGIHANSQYPAEFIYENLTIASNIIEGSRRANVQRLLNLGSSCIYPKQSPQPIKESYLLESQLEVTNEAYAVAKIAALKMCQHYRNQYDLLYHSAMPTNLYGTGDNYHPENSHVVPGLIRRIHQAKIEQLPSVTIWGTGNPRREFLHVDDLAVACMTLIEQANPPDWINIGTGYDISIKELAELIIDIVGFKGTIENDYSKADGTPQKLLDVSLCEQMSWRATISLQDGLERAYRSFLEEIESKTLRM